MKTRKQIIRRQDIPEGAVQLRTNEQGQTEFVARTGSERCKLVDGVWLIFPANKLSRALPLEGPFIGLQDTSREFSYMTYNAPDPNGVFIPVKLDVHPEDLIERIDARQAKVAKLTPAQREAMGL